MTKQTEVSTNISSVLMRYETNFSLNKMLRVAFTELEKKLPLGLKRSHIDDTPIRGSFRLEKRFLRRRVFS